MRWPWVGSESPRRRARRFGDRRIGPLLGSAPPGGVGAPAFGGTRAGRAAVVGGLTGSVVRHAGEGLEGHGAPGDGPLVAGLEHEGADQPDGGRIVREIVREDAHHVRAPLDLAADRARAGSRTRSAARARGRGPWRPARPAPDPDPGGPIRGARSGGPDPGGSCEASVISPSLGRRARSARAASPRRLAAASPRRLGRGSPRARIAPGVAETAPRCWAPTGAEAPLGPAHAASPRRRGLRPARRRPAAPRGRRPPPAPRRAGPRRAEAASGRGGVGPRPRKEPGPRRTLASEGPCREAQHPWRAVRARPGGARSGPREARPGPGPPGVLVHRDGRDDGAADGEGSPATGPRPGPGAGPNPVLADLQVGRVEPRAGPAALDRARQEGPDPLVDVGAQPAHPGSGPGQAPALRDARPAQGARRRASTARVETPWTGACLE